MITLSTSVLKDVETRETWALTTFFNRLSQMNHIYMMCYSYEEETIYRHMITLSLVLNYVLEKRNINIYYISTDCRFTCKSGIPGQYQGIQETSITLSVAGERRQIFLLHRNMFVPYPLLVTTPQHASQASRASTREYRRPPSSSVSQVSENRPLCCN